MKVRSLVDKFTLKEKRKYIVKGEIYDVLHEEERGYAVTDLEGDDVILRLSECEVVEEDNLKPNELVKWKLEDKVKNRLKNFYCPHEYDINISCKNKCPIEQMKKCWTEVFEKYDLLLSTQRIYKFNHGNSITFAFKKKNLEGKDTCV